MVVCGTTAKVVASAVVDQRDTLATMDSQQGLVVVLAVMTGLTEAVEEQLVLTGSGEATVAILGLSVTVELIRI